jgi:hypothetical protein
VEGRVVVWTYMERVQDGSAGDEQRSRKLDGRERTFAGGTVF